MREYQESQLVLRVYGRGAGDAAPDGNQSVQMLLRNEGSVRVLFSPRKQSSHPLILNWSSVKLIYVQSELPPLQASIHWLSQVPFIVRAVGIRNQRGEHWFSYLISLPIWHPQRNPTSPCLGNCCVLLRVSLRCRMRQQENRLRRFCCKIIAFWNSDSSARGQEKPSSTEWPWAIVSL